MDSIKISSVLNQLWLIYFVSGFFSWIWYLKTQALFTERHLHHASPWVFLKYSLDRHELIYCSHDKQFIFRENKGLITNDFLIDSESHRCFNQHEVSCPYDFQFTSVVFLYGDHEFQLLIINYIECLKEHVAMACHLYCVFFSVHHHIWSDELGEPRCSEVTELCLTFIT